MGSLQGFLCVAGGEDGFGEAKDQAVSTDDNNPAGASEGNTKPLLYADSIAHSTVGCLRSTSLLNNTLPGSHSLVGEESYQLPQRQVKH